MGMYLTVKGIAPPDEQWKKMKNVYDSCKAVDCAVPSEVLDFFHDFEPDDAGVVISLHNHHAVTEIDGGFDIVLEDLPDAIHIIRCVLE